MEGDDMELETDDSDELVDQKRRKDVGLKTQGGYLNVCCRFLRRAREKARGWLVDAFKDKYLNNLEPPKSKKGKEQDAAIKEALKRGDVSSPPVTVVGSTAMTAAELGKYLNYVEKGGDKKLVDGKSRGVSAIKTARSGVLWMLRRYKLHRTPEFNEELGNIWKGFVRENVQQVNYNSL
jgi:hypothetical protein